MKLTLLILASFLVSGCSVIGQSDVKTAPYILLKSDESQKIEVRNYGSMVLVSTTMSSESGYSAFRALFGYITGDNEGATKISMTAPVFINDNAQQSSMSFVMPKDFTLATTPKPTNPDVRLSELKDYKVATIQFSGTLSDSNVEEYSRILINWISENSYTSISDPVKAGYNGPTTLPMFRRNEILIEVK